MPHYANTSQYSAEENLLWQRLREKQGEEFHTAKGLSFTYEIRGNEFFVSRRGKSITRSTVNIAYKKACEMGGIVKGPKTLGVFGASYIYAVFVSLGVIGKSQEQNE